MVCLALLLWRRPSDEKSTAIIAYFALWLIGPLVHLLMPAAGPVLSDALAGRSSGLAVVPADAEKFNYLLLGLRTSSFTPAGGISAMPSLHIATMAWTVFVCRPASPMRSLAIVLTAYMWAASVALGWHYLVDGLAGIAVAAVAMLFGRATVNGLAAADAAPTWRLSLASLRR